MESIANLIDKLSINNFDVGSEHWVEVTHINNPHSFYVRPTSYRIHLLVLHSHEDQLLPTDVHLGSIVIYKSSLLRCFVRGRVMFVQSENDGEIYCDVFAPDYGCFEKSIPLKSLRKPIHSVDIPPLAMHCQLADCKPRTDTWDNKTIEAMKFFVGKEKTKMVIRGKTPDSFVVELFNFCPDDIATMLALNGYTTIGYGDNMISRLAAIQPEKQYYAVKQYEEGDTIDVRVQSGDCLRKFYVAEEKDYKHYLNERDNLTYFCRNRKVLQPENVKVGMAVGALMITSNKYERALVTEITVPDEKAKVMLVDWGKFIEVPFSRLKPMSPKFFELPACAIHCAAEESQAYDNDLHKFLYLGYRFKITIVKVGEQFESPHIVTLSPLKKS